MTIDNRRRGGGTNLWYCPFLRSLLINKSWRLGWLTSHVQVQKSSTLASYPSWSAGRVSRLSYSYPTTCFYAAVPAAHCDCLCFMTGGNQH